MVISVCDLHLHQFNISEINEAVKIFSTNLFPINNRKSINRKHRSKTGVFYKGSAFCKSEQIGSYSATEGCETFETVYSSKEKCIVRTGYLHIPKE